MSLIPAYKRSIYLIYYLKKIDRLTLKKYFKHVIDTKGYSTQTLWMDIISCVYKYNIGLMDYFIFKFFDRDKEERAMWLGTGAKYEYDLIMNPKSTRHLIENKIDFYEVYAPFVQHANCTIYDLKQENIMASKVLNNFSKKVVVKDALGQCGWDVEVLNLNDYSREELIQYMIKKGFDLAEEFIEQHSDLSKLSPSGLNTIRIITQINKQGEVDILGACLRISVNSHVDNLASGNIAAPVDIDSGIVCSVGVYSDITKENVENHPVTGMKISGFQIPFWVDAIMMAKKAALYRPENRSIGWDVAITPNGPDLVEGNHNWCKILWQLPVNKGLKNSLEQYV